MKKTAMLLLALLMLVTMFAGCNSGNGSETTTAPSTTAATTAGATTPKATTASTAHTTAPQVTTTATAAGMGYGDVAPEDQIEYINYDGPVPIIKDGYDIAIRAGVILETGFPCNVTDNWLIDFTNDQLNVNFSTEHIMDAEKQNLLFASNQVPDMFLNLKISTSQIVVYGMTEKQIQPYNPYMEHYMPSLDAYFKSDPAAVAYYTTPTGEMFMMPRTLEPTTVVGSYIRQKWLDILELPQPKTLDEFTETMIAFRDAGAEKLEIEKVIPIGGGFKSEYANPNGIILEAFGYLERPYWADWDKGSGYRPSLRLADGGVEDYGLPINDEIFFEVLKYQNLWYTENLYDAEYFSMDGTQARANNAAGYTGWTNVSEGIGDVPGGLSEWRMLAPLTSEWNSTPQSANYPIYGNSGFYIGTTEYPEVVARWFELTFHPDWDYIMLKGPIEGDPRTPTYGLKAYSWGVDKNGLPCIVIEGEVDEKGNQTHNTYKNTHYQPTYMDQCLINTFDGQARWQSAVSGEKIEPNSKEKNVEKAKKQMAEDPETYKSNIFTITMYDARGAYSGNGVYQPLQYVYRDADTNQTIADLDAILKPYIQENMALFISNRRPLDEFTKFQEELRQMGINDYDDILAAEYEAFKANQ